MAKTITYNGQTAVLKEPKPSAPSEPDDVPPGSGLWNPPMLYTTRSIEKRRIMFLELIVWAIYQAETCGSRDDFAAFERELVEVRQGEYVRHPWNGVTEREPFLRHVVNMAEAFTAETPEFPARRRQPVEQP